MSTARPSPSWPASHGDEEPEAPELFDQVLDELGLSFEPPADPTAARWAHAFWLAEEITSGSLDPATGAELIWPEVAEVLDYSDVLQPTVVVNPEASNGAVHLCSWVVGHWRAGRCRSCLNGRERG